MMMEPSAVSSTRSHRPRTRMSRRRRQGHAERPLDERRPRAGSLLLVPEAPDGRAPGLAARRLVGPREESLVAPLVVVRLQEILERRVGGPRAGAGSARPRGGASPRIQPCGATDLDAQDVHTGISAGTSGSRRLAVAECQHNVGPEGRLRPRRARPAARTRADPRSPPPSRGMAASREVERLEHELTGLSRPPATIVMRPRQVKRLLRPGHRDVEEPALLPGAGNPATMAGPECVRQPQDIAPARPGKPALHQPDHEHHRELQPLGLVDSHDAHGRRVDVHLGDGRILARRSARPGGHELPHVVAREHPGRVLDPAEEPRDVLDLRLLPGSARPRHPPSHPLPARN